MTGLPELPLSGAAFAYDVAVIGAAMPTALAFHEAGRRVVVAEPDPDRLAAIRSLDCGLTGPDQDRLRDALGAGFTLSADPAALGSAQTVLVGSRPAAAVAAAVPGQLLILTAASATGSTARQLERPLAARGLDAGADLSIAFGAARIGCPTEAVTGGITPDCTRHAAKALGLAFAVVHELSSAEAAELTALTERAAAAVTSAFAIEIAAAAHGAGVDPAEVLRAAAAVPQAGPPVAWPVPAPVIEAALASLGTRPAAVVARAAHVLAEDGLRIDGARVLVIGVTHAPGHPDAEDSPAIEILQGLIDAGAAVAYHDPLAPRISLSGGRTLTSTAHPRDLTADLVIVHTIQLGADLTWLDASHLVLDTTYRLGGRYRHPVL